MHLRGVLSFCLLVALIPAWISCGGSSEPEADAVEPASYTIRGVVRQITDLGDSRAQIFVHHEAIAQFVGINGDVVGMKSMTMPFAVADTVDLTDVRAGSKVSFELSVDWDRAEPGLIVALEVLPDETVLNLGSAE